MTTSIYDLSHSELKARLKEASLTPFAADQIFAWIYKKFEIDPEKWTNVSKLVKEFVGQEFDLTLPKIVWEAISNDGTKKFLLQFSDKQTVETVVIPARERLTICISSQVGCAIGCTFCHTATQGLKRHLRPGEVTGQFLAVSRWLIENMSNEEKITNIVYMGQGEPLHNFDNMLKATEIFIDEKAFALGQRRITLSTSGLVPQIEKLALFPPVNIAISLHSARNDVRSELMPINKVYDLERLFTAIKTIPLKAYRRITYEYLLIDELNDTEEDVEALCKLLRREESKINLIPFNDFPGSKFKRPKKEKVLWFMETMNQRGYTTTIRATKGSDILAACGQLKSEVEKHNTW
ncbi:MAG: 23S rRNA (adenine(2503)-C(2))-methyltransferase RlmN [Bacteriovoracaceae bacterium]